MNKKQSELRKTEVEGAKGGSGTFYNTHILEKDEMCGKGRYFARCTLKPGSSVGAHTHIDEMEVYYILSGSGIIIEDEKKTAIAAGDVNLVGAGENHSIVNNGDVDLDFIAVILYS